MAPDSLETYDYTIGRDAVTGTVPQFTLVTTPDATHGLCGDLEYEFCVDGDCDVPVDPDADSPIGFNPDDREVEIETSDPNDEG